MLNQQLIYRKTSSVLKREIAWIHPAISINLKKLLLKIATIFLSLIVFGLHAQKSVYYFQDTGFDTLTIFDNNTFKSSGGIGLAESIEYSGDCKILGDTFVLIHKTPLIINKLDTSYHLLNSQDTFFRLDELTLVLINQDDYNIYKLIERYDNNMLSAEYHWKYSNHTIENMTINGKHFESMFKHNFPLQHGLEIHYDKNGIIEKESHWENGELRENQRIKKTRRLLKSDCL